MAGTFPDEALVREALANVPFLVVQDLFLTETAKYADVVLPAAEFPAKSGSYTNFEGRVQRVEQAMEPTGLSRTDGDIFRAVAEVMGEKLISSEQEFRWEMQHLLERIAKEGFIGGVPEDVVRSARAPSTVEEGRSTDGTLQVVPVDRLYGGGGTARFDRWFSYVQPKAEAFIHPDDAQALALADGDTVDLGTGEDAIRCTVRVDGDVLRGTVQVPKGVVDAPVYRLQRGAAYPVVQVHKRVLEEVG